MIHWVQPTIVRNMPRTLTRERFISPKGFWRLCCNNDIIFGLSGTAQACKISINMERSDAEGKHALVQAGNHEDRKIRRTIQL